VVSDLAALGRYAAYFFDVDGTLLYADRAIPGAPETLATLKRHGKAVLAVTNNSSFNRHQVAERFRRFGLPLEDAEVFSALTATAQLIAHEHPGARVHVFGNAGLRAELERFGLTPTDDEDADYVAMGNNYGVDYAWLTRTIRTLLGGARWITVNVDRLFVGQDGGPIPGAGTFAAALERATGRAPDVVVGKPSATILCEADQSVGQPPSACLNEGDNAEADVVGAHAAGMHALLVRTGVEATAVVPGHRPEHVLPSVADLALAFDQPTVVRG
jgi:HAD superfamily hydrolase (TIGR01450 family)